MILLLCLLVLVLTFCSAFFSLSEIAFFSLSSARVKAFRHNLDPQKRKVAKILFHSQSLLVSIFLLNTVANILIQNISSDLVDSFGRVSFSLKIGIPLVLILVCGEFIPKYLGLLHNESIALKAAPFYDYFQKISKPLRELIFHVAYFFSRIFFFYMKAEKPLSEEELEHILESSEDRGLLAEDETTLLKSFLSLEKKQVIDVMCPRGEVEYYDITEPLSSLKEHFTQKKQKGVLVCRGGLDHFLGILEAKEFLIHRDEIKKAEDVSKYLSSGYFVPETTSIKFLLLQLQARSEEVAIIIDEYGTLSGLITRRDLISLLCQSRKEELQDYTRVGKGAIIAEAKMPLEAISDLMGYTLTSSYHQVTISGYLLEKLGGIPKIGTIYQEGPLVFKILEASEKHIMKVFISNAMEGV
jgi:putative hemolysin